MSPAESMTRQVPMRFLSVCSGIEAASVAWHPLGWRPVAFSEIEPFPCSLLAHHYPDVPNLGDMTRFDEWPDATVDLLCGGTPCQSFSVAGLRKGLADPRGNLMLTFGAIAARYRPRWLVWENVPGVLSSNGGRDFGAFLGMLGQLGYGFAYRVLDAQFFGVAQRRRRVFVVGCLGDWRRAAAVLFERHSLSGHPAPSRETGAGTPVGALAGTSPGGGWRVGADEAAAGQLVAFGGNNRSGAIDVAAGLNAKGGAGRMDFDSETFICGHHPSLLQPASAGLPDGRCGGVAGDRLGIAHALTGEGFDASEDGTGCGTPLVPVAFDTYNQTVTGDTTQTLCSRGDTPGGNAHLVPAIAFGWQNSAAQSASASEHHSPTLDKSKTPAVMHAAAVRRLTPRECERLQGFPDDYTLIPHRGKPAADGPRYKALGNSWAVPVVRWIGRRIELVEAITERIAA